MFNITIIIHDAHWLAACVGRSCVWRHQKIIIMFLLLVRRTESSGTQWAAPQQSHGPLEKKETSSNQNIKPIRKYPIVRLSVLGHKNNGRRGPINQELVYHSVCSLCSLVCPSCALWGWRQPQERRSIYTPGVTSTDLRACARHTPHFPSP